VAAGRLDISSGLCDAVKPNELPGKSLSGTNALHVMPSGAYMTLNRTSLPTASVVFHIISPHDDNPWTSLTSIIFDRRVPESVGLIANINPAAPSATPLVTVAFPVAPAVSIERVPHAPAPLPAPVPA
jgi:hypothetical protein